ncbi:hypothetical protein [Streptomyces sp. 2R]|uniref:hypothetical protein n=1 Tax=Streptomyces sp. 2R TaxID=1883452 RepID=UPI00211AD4FE|nr:hypothetical protein [Streptomyces sp. 2R]
MHADIHTDIHLALHADRAAELRDEAQESHLPRTRLRTRIGWTMVEVGLRLARSGATPTRGRTFRTA